MYFDELDTFLNAIADVFSFIGDMFSELFYTFFGSWNEITVNHLWFWLAWLPFVLSFSVEIIFSFILSLRIGRVSLFVPWRASSYSALRLGSVRSGRAYAPAAVSLPYVKREKLYKSLSGQKNVPLLEFRNVDSKRTIHDDSTGTFKPLFTRDYKGNHLKYFIPRFKTIIRRGYGVDQKTKVHDWPFVSVTQKMRSQNISKKGGK